MALPANITTGSDNNVLSIAASNNKGLLIRFLNEQVEDGFYALVIDYLKDSNFDLANMMVDEEVKAQCTKLYELGAFVDENIKLQDATRLKSGLSHYLDLYMEISILQILMLLSAQQVFTDIVSGLFIFIRERSLQML